MILETSIKQNSLKLVKFLTDSTEFSPKDWNVILKRLDSKWSFDMIKLMFENGNNSIKNNFSHQFTKEQEQNKNISEIFEFSLKIGRIDVVKYVVEVIGFDVKTLKDLHHPVWICCVYSQLELLKYFAEVVGFDLKTLYFGTDSPLAAAVYRGHLEIMKYLLDYGVDVNQRLSHGSSVFWLACAYDELSAVRLLAESPGIDPNIVANSGKSPFFMAISSRKLDIVAYLLERKDVDVERADKSGQTPLGNAIEVGSFEIIECLIQSKRIDVNKVSNGQTPLQLALGKERSDIVQFLIEHGAK